MASGRLPPETWETILRYAIAVPVFFDTDPIESSGMEDYLTLYQEEASYWESEHCRNSLRRVCSSWNIYLEEFKHRFVRLDDVVEPKKHVPLAAVPRAIRVHTEISSWWYRTPVEREAILSSFLDKELGPWSVEILEGGVTRLDDRLISSSRLPRLKCALRVMQYRTLSIPSSLNLLYELGYIHTLPQSEPWLHLTTLRVSMKTASPCSTWKLPSLRHLGIYCTHMNANNFIEMLRAIGNNLITLFDDSTSTDTIPEEIGSLCPRLERLQTSFLWANSTPIPSNVRYIRISPRILRDLNMSQITGAHPSINDRFPVDAFHRAGIRIVAINLAWWELLFQNLPLVDLVIDRLALALDYGLTLKDTEGTRWQDFIVNTLLLTFWKSGSREGSNRAREAIEKKRTLRF